MKYLNNIKTLEELKKAYYKLAMKMHPDKGGDVEEMKVLNNEYDALFAKVSHVHVNKDGQTYERKTNEKPEEFKDIIDALMKMSGITIEVIGSFVWVSGDTKPNKDQLKAMGFRWHSKKLNWYKSPEGYRKFNRKQYSMDEVRDMFGSRFYAETDTAKAYPATV